jgi:DNA-binding GntR family transcriptional regulator
LRFHFACRRERRPDWSRLTREDFEEIYAARLEPEGLAARVGAAAVGPEETERSSRRPLVEEVERLYWRSERYNRLVLSTPERFRESVDRYADFLAACEARDRDATERAVQETIRWGLDPVADGLPSESDAT